MLPIAENTEIDQDALIKCPVVDFQYKRASKCPTCPGFMGLGVLSEDENLLWDQRFIIRCSAMVERRTQIIRVIEE